MFRVLSLLVMLVIHGVYGQDCVPEPISDLKLDINSTLHWQPSTNCDDTFYLIYLLQDDGLEHIYQVDVPWLDVTFLRACELYRFIIYAHAGTLLSESRHIDAVMPVQPAANLTVTHLVATQEGDDSVLLEWGIDEKFEHCIHYYRVVRWDGETLPIDTYTGYNYILFNNLAPCSTYEFTVTPIYNNDWEGGIGLVEHYIPPHSAHFPWIESVTPGDTYADMVWRLPTYVTNRCEIETFILDASPHINLTIPIHDTPGRPPIVVRAFPLLSDRMYLFRVSMVNTGGASKPIQIAVQTLPAALN